MNNQYNKGFLLEPLNSHNVNMDFGCPPWNIAMATFKRTLTKTRAEGDVDVMDGVYKC